MKSIDINCDMGESFGNYKCGLDSELIKYISSANIACGFHASDPMVMYESVKLAKRNGVDIGAHPGFPDLVGFGRRKMNVSEKELRSMVIYQIGALKAFCDSEGIRLSHVKPHGAMYNMAARDEKMARTIAEAIACVDSSLILLGLSGSCLIDAASAAGIESAGEVFADRAYDDDGSLVARSRDGSMITDENEAIERVVEMVTNGRVKSINGNYVKVNADSICIHGDGESAVSFAKIINKRLTEENIRIISIGASLKVGKNVA